jgi:triosephosphate isomerase
MKIIIANWKMNPGSLVEARRLAIQIEQGLLGTDRSRGQVVICPPFVYLHSIGPILHFASLGAQDAAAEKEGAFTGEISPGMLAGLGVEYVIIGHSERRALGESDQLINQKLKTALANKLRAILCVGHGTKKGASGKLVERIIRRQIQEDLRGVKYKQGNLVIVYEPVWAIGTNTPPTLRHACQTISYLKSLLPKIRVLYGGSIDGKNVFGFAKEKIIDGGLVGGASLNPPGFLKIIEAFSSLNS